MTNLLSNPAFEIPWDGSHDCIVYPLGDGTPYHATRPEIQRPTGWQLYYVHAPDTGLASHAWHQPEATYMHRHLTPERIHAGNSAYRIFCSFNPFWSGLFTRVAVAPGRRYQIIAHAHAWTNHPIPGDDINCDGDPFCSVGAGRGGFASPFDQLPAINEEPWNDALHAARFRVGIDPHGGTDPFADTVVWSSAWAIYNHFAPVAVTTTARASMVTVFLDTRLRWAFRNNDAYWDAASLEQVGGPSPDPPLWTPPAFQYAKTAVLLSPDAGPPTRAAVGAALSHPQLRSTATQSAEDAGSGPADTTVKALGWGARQADLQEYFDTHYPHAKLSFIDGATPTEAALQLLPPLAEDIALSQRDPRWADHYFGEDPGSNLRAYGCFVTAAAIALRRVYEVDVKPDLLDQLLVNARHAFVGGNLLDWHGFCGLFGRFTDPVRSNTRLPNPVLAQKLQDHVIILRRADGAHFVYLERVDGADLHVIDPWDGQRRIWRTTEQLGYRSARIRPVSPVPVPDPPPAPPAPPPASGPYNLFGAQEQRHGIGRDEFIARVKPPAWMLIQAYEDARRIKELSPDTLVVMRHVDNDWQSYLYADDVDAAARRFIDRFRGALERNAEWIDYVQDLNEYIACNDYRALRASGPWMEAFCAELDRMGYPARPVGFNAGVGNPQHNWICDAQGIERQIPLMLRGVRALHHAGGAFGYHGYHGRRADGFSTLTTADGEGRPNRIHFSMRALLSQDPVFVQHGIHIDHIITECGAIYYDHYHGMPNAEAGWLWHQTMAHDRVDRYIDDILLLNRYFREWNAANDNRLLAAIIFLYGGYHGWRYFDLEGDFAVRLAQALEADREAS